MENKETISNHLYMNSSTHQRSTLSCHKLICLNSDYSTTRLLSREKPIIINKTEDKFKTLLFLSANEERRCEGGLRTKGYFKHSYVRDRGGGSHISTSNDDKNWWIVDRNENLQKKIQMPENLTLTSYSYLPLISIVTAVYNGEKYLEETIQSVINQTYPNVEYIIIDGCSHDGTLDIIKKYEDIIDYWVSEKDNGMYEAIHKGFTLSNGNIFSWINADDVYYENTLNFISKIFKSNKNLKWITGVPNAINAKSEMIAVGRPKYYFRYFLKKGYYRGDYLGFIQQEGTFFKSNLYKKCPLDQKLQYAGDYKLWIDFSKYEKLHTVKTILASFRNHTNQKSKNLEAYYKECNKVSKNINRT